MVSACYGNMEVLWILHPTLLSLSPLIIPTYPQISHLTLSSHILLCINFLSPVFTSPPSFLLHPPHPTPALLSVASATALSANPCHHLPGLLQRTLSQPPLQSMHSGSCIIHWSST